QPLLLHPKAKPTTVGHFVLKLLTHQKFEGALLLPRLPPALAREITAQLADQFPSLKAQKKRDREDIPFSSPSSSSSSAKHLRTR
ncbi:MAG: hypothetical protein Q8P67_09625, partial [archaeon]|nr:hypothetical protein [archaeon]